MTRSILATLLLALAASVNADTFRSLTFNPPSLDSHTPLTAVVVATSPGVCIPLGGKSSISGSTITLTVIPGSSSCPAVPITWSQPVFIGTLAPGRYDVITTFGSEQFDTRSIFIADADPPFQIVENVGVTNGIRAPVTIFAPPGAKESMVAATVTFDEVPAMVVSMVGDRVVVIPPLHAPGAATVKLTFPSGAAYTSIGGFRYVDLGMPRDRAAHEAILIPLVFAGDGAFGSSWTTDLWVHNDTPFNISQLDGPFASVVCVAPPCLQPLYANRTMKLDVPPSFSPFPHGRIMYVPRGSGAGLHFDLRVHDTKRQGETHGVAIPVVRERDLRDRAFSLLDVPGDAQYRARLRIYSIDPQPDSSLASSPFIRLFTMSDNALVGQQAFTLSDRDADTPAYAELDLDPLIRAATKPGPYRVEVDLPIPTVSPSYWGFVSITNNQTQNVTVVTPQ